MTRLPSFLFRTFGQKSSPLVRVLVWPYYNLSLNWFIFKGTFLKGNHELSNTQTPQTGLPSLALRNASVLQYWHWLRLSIVSGSLQPLHCLWLWLSSYVFSCIVFLHCVVSTRTASRAKCTVPSQCFFLGSRLCVQASSLHYLRWRTHIRQSCHQWMKTACDHAKALQQNGQDACRLDTCKHASATVFLG